MQEFLNNEFVQFVSALCTFAGGIAAIIPLLGMINSTNIIEQDREMPVFIDYSEWISKESNIIKKSYHQYGYKIFTILFSGNTSHHSFLFLIKLLSIPAILLALIGVIFPYPLVVAIFWFSCWIFIFSIIVDLEEMGKEMKEELLTYFPNLIAILITILVFFPAFLTIVFFPTFLTIEFFPKWIIVIFFPLIVIIGYYAMWLGINKKKLKATNIINE